MYYKLIRNNTSLGASNENSKAVHGKLYRTSHYINKRTGLLVERLHYICDTLENADYLVPALIYKVQVTQSPKFKRLLPILCQVPGRSGIRIMGAPENFNFWGERRTRETYRCDEVASQSEGIERDSQGCILISPADEQTLTARWLSEQTASDETRLEICNNINYYRK